MCVLRAGRRSPLGCGSSALSAPVTVRAYSLLQKQASPASPGLSRPLGPAELDCSVSSAGLSLSDARVSRVGSSLGKEWGHFVNTDWGVPRPLLPKIEGQAKKAEERTALSQAPRVWVSGQVLAQGL